VASRLDALAGTPDAVLTTALPIFGARAHPAALRDALSLVSKVGDSPRADEARFYAYLQVEKAIVEFPGFSGQN
jgi:hypothetical protein